MIVHHVELPPDAATVRALLRTNDPDHGTLVVQARPDVRRSSTLVHDLLTAMGKHHNVKGTGRSTGVDARYLGIWLESHRVREVVLVESNWLRPGVLDEVLPVLRRADVDLVLADRLPTSDHHDEVIRGLDALRGTVGDLANGEVRPPPPDVAFPLVPDDDFVTFLWSCRQLLAGDDLELVDQRYRAGASAASRITDPRPHCSELAAALRPLWALVRSADEAVTVIRGCQSGLFPRARLRVDLDRLRGAGSIATELADSSTWQRLRAYRQPYRGASITLIAMGLGIDDAARLPLGAIDPSGQAAVIAGRSRQTPAGAEPLLRAMRLERELDGAGLGEPLLARLGERISNASIARAVTDAALDLGVRAVEGQLQRRVTDRDWLRQRGISLEVVA